MDDPCDPPVICLKEPHTGWSESITRSLVTVALNALPEEPEYKPLGEFLRGLDSAQNWAHLEKEELQKWADQLALSAHTRKGEAGLLGLQRDAGAGRITGIDDESGQDELVRADALLALACERLLSLHHFRCELHARRGAKTP
ncbi:MAG TPA: hypothetical protein ENJ18_06475 [Nannocystis exedens]|nr:hypothetical protein [Nannocystis exedens]